jgi:hypothetical protein
VVYIGRKLPSTAKPLAKRQNKMFQPKYQQQCNTALPSSRHFGLSSTPLLKSNDLDGVQGKKIRIRYKHHLMNNFLGRAGYSHLMKNSIRKGFAFQGALLASGSSKLFNSVDDQLPL